MSKNLIRFTKKDFERFQAYFLYWQKEFSCQDCEVVFEFKHLPDAIAQVLPVGEDRYVVTLGKVIPKYYLAFYGGLINLAKHEALHLLLTKVTNFVSIKTQCTPEYSLAEERLVTILEKLIHSPKE